MVRAVGQRLAPALWLALSLVLSPVAGPAQVSEPQAATPRGDQVLSPILTVDSERLYNDSAFGRRAAAEIDAASTRLATENRAIEAELEAEEKALTERRSGLPAAEFRGLADAFDQKVQRIRREREAETRALSQRFDDDRVKFLNAAAPVLEDLMRDAGAAVILERRSVFLSANAIDITDEAIARIDETLGDGAGATD